MYRLIETIKIKDDKIFNINYHNIRMNNTRKDLFNCNDFIDLNDFINIPENNNEIIKCRVIYNMSIINIEYNKYHKRIINSLKLVYDDNIIYKYKHEDRDAINNLLKLKADCDDILIIKNNRITDTSFTNIAFYDGKIWLTPIRPLLNGTKREELLDEGIIKEKDILFNDLKKFKKAILFNSLLGFEDEMFIEIKNIK